MEVVDVLLKVSFFTILDIFIGLQSLNIEDFLSFIFNSILILKFLHNFIILTSLILIQ